MVNTKKIDSQNGSNINKNENLTLLLKEKESEIRIAKQKSGYFSRKHAEVLIKLKKMEGKS